MIAPTRRAAIALALALLGAGLYGCGQMGPLVLPEEAAEADDEETTGGNDERN